MRILRWAGLVLAAVIALGAVVLLGARFHDGPVGMFPGGPLRDGPLDGRPLTDWSFVAEKETIELQLLSQDRSRTTWILVYDGEAFIPCSLGFPPGKTWYRYAVQDGRAVIRIDGPRYPVSLVRVEDPELIRPLAEVVHSKYGAGPPGDADVWYFRVTSRTAG